ncbi:MAG: hypothetical protein COA85_11950 [Robiginitomaculum sp.]|nr:MAG: hypothetical protein COA85_11950 [Robiginitomaculum sp.]
MAMQFRNHRYGLSHIVMTALAFFAMANVSVAQEFRKMRRIARPPVTKPVVPDAKAPAVLEKLKMAPQPGLPPITRDVAEKAIGMLVDAWNSNTLQSVLADSFFDKSRLTDAMDTKVPRDAELSVLAIQDVQTLKQKIDDTPDGKVLVSTVSITVRSQLTFNDPDKGYQRREGVNEYIMRIRQKKFLIYDLP